MINLKRTAEMARENLVDSNAILDNILGRLPAKEDEKADENAYGLIGDLNDDLEVLLGLSAIIKSRLNELRGIVSIQVCEADCHC